MNLEMNELYRTRTQEEYDWLMQKLEDEECKWTIGKLPTEFDTWSQYGEDTVVWVESKEISLSGIYYATETRPDIEIIEVSDLMDPLVTKIQERNNKPAHDPIKPNHYKGTNGLEVYDVMKQFLPYYDNPYTGYQIGNVLKYTLRAPRKGQLEDLKKAQRSLEQAIEYMEEGVE